MVGRPRKEIALNANITNLQVSVTDLEIGIYAYKYFINGAQYGAGKLVIE